MEQLKYMYHLYRVHLGLLLESLVINISYISSLEIIFLRIVTLERKMATYIFIYFVFISLWFNFKTKKYQLASFCTCFLNSHL